MEKLVEELKFIIASQAKVISEHREAVAPLTACLERSPPTIYRLWLRRVIW